MYPLISIKAVNLVIVLWEKMAEISSGDKHGAIVA